MCDNSITIDGTAQTFASPSIGSTGSHLLGTVSQTVNHASDGSKSLTISAVFNIRATLSGTYYGSITASRQGLPQSGGTGRTGRSAAPAFDPANSAGTGSSPNG